VCTYKLYIAAMTAADANTRSLRRVRSLARRPAPARRRGEECPARVVRAPSRARAYAMYTYAAEETESVPRL
jgi:hypothetical protein